MPINSYAALPKYNIVGENPKMTLFKMLDEDGNPVKGISGDLFKRGYQNGSEGYSDTSVIPFHETNKDGEFIIPENKMDKGEYFVRFKDPGKLGFQKPLDFDFEYDPSKGEEAFKTLPPLFFRKENSSDQPQKETFHYPVYKKDSDGKDVIYNIYERPTVGKVFSDQKDGKEMINAILSESNFEKPLYSHVKMRIPANYKQLRGGIIIDDFFGENMLPLFDKNPSNMFSGDHPIEVWYEAVDGQKTSLSNNQHFKIEYDTAKNKIRVQMDLNQIIRIGKDAHGFDQSWIMPNEKLFKTGYLHISSPLKGDKASLSKKEDPIQQKTTVEAKWWTLDRFYGENKNIKKNDPVLETKRESYRQGQLLLFKIKKEIKSGQMGLRLIVPEKEGDTEYLDGSEYDIYLKYLIDDNGKLLDPKTFALAANQTNDHGKLPDLSAAYKMGTLKIHGGTSEFEISSDGHPSLVGKNLERAIYTIVPIKRAPQYFLDKRPDGKYAEVEFPKIASDGSPASTQIFEITLKAEKAQKGNKELFLFTKKDIDDNPIEGMKFRLIRIGVGKKVDSNGKVPKNKYFHVKEVIADLESDSQGRVIVPASTHMPAGAYVFYEMNANEKGYFKTSFEFTYLPDDEGKMRMDYKDKALGKENPLLKKYLFPYDQLTDIESGEHLTLYNYDFISFDHKVVGNDGSEAEVNTVSPNENYGYKGSFRLLSDYLEYEKNEVNSVKHTFPKNKVKTLISENIQTENQISPLIGGSDLSKELSVWYKKPNGETHEIEQGKHFKVIFKEEKENHPSWLYIGLDRKHYENIIRDIHQKDPGDENKIGKYEKMGEIIFQVKALVKGNSVEEADFEASSEGILSLVRHQHSTKSYGYDNFPKYVEDGTTAHTDGFSSYQMNVFTNKTVYTKPIRVKINLLKTDGENAVLPNAEFMVYDVNDDSAEPLKPYDHASTDPYTVKSDDQGRITAEKLPYRLGGYFLKEVKAPQGYRLPKALLPMENKIQLPMVGNTGDAGQYDLTLGSHTDADQIVNIKKGEDIVNTGTMGTIASFLGGGSVLILGLMLKSLRKL